MDLRLPPKMVVMTIWAMWWLILLGMSLWLIVGSVAYFVKAEYLPADTAGWAQALGGFLAVVAAISVPYYQARRSMIEREADARLGRADNSRAVYSLVNHYQVLTNRVIVESTLTHIHGVRDTTLPKELRDAVPLLQGLVVNAFGSEMVFYVLGLRKVAAFCEHAAELFETKAAGIYLDTNNFSSLRTRAEGQLRLLETWLHQVGDYEAKLRVSKL